MLRKSSILMVGAFLLTVFGSALLVHSLDNQATEVETRDMTRLPFTASERPKDALAVSTIQPENQPPDNWRLMATDPDEGSQYDLKAVYAQVYSNIMYFKVECYRNWSDMFLMSCHIWIDTDQDPSTAHPVGNDPGSIGADYWIAVDPWMMTMFEWDFDDGAFTIYHDFAYLELPIPGNTFVVGVYLSDLGSPEAFDAVVQDAWSVDWMPNTGHFTFRSCLCGDVNGDGSVAPNDVVYLINYFFRAGPPPDCQ